MAKTPYDLALLLDAIVVKSIGSLEHGSCANSLSGSWSELSVAAVDDNAFISLHPS
jgi:hypothetical protein